MITSNISTQLQQTPVHAPQFCPVVPGGIGMGGGAHNMGLVYGKGEWRMKDD